MQDNYGIGPGIANIPNRLAAFCKGSTHEIHWLGSLEETLHDGLPKPGTAHLQDIAISFEPL